MPDASPRRRVEHPPARPALRHTRISAARRRGEHHHEADANHRPRPSSLPDSHVTNTHAGEPMHRTCRVTQFAPAGSR
jgi:hypothetical protein